MPVCFLFVLQLLVLRPSPASDPVPEVHGLTFSPTGILATTCCGIVRLWDPVRGEQLLALPGHEAVKEGGQARTQRPHREQQTGGQGAWTPRTKATH